MKFGLPADRPYYRSFSNHRNLKIAAFIRPVMCFRDQIFGLLRPFQQIFQSYVGKITGHFGPILILTPGSFDPFSHVILARFWGGLPLHIFCVVLAHFISYCFSI